MTPAITPISKIAGENVDCMTTLFQCPFVVSWQPRSNVRKWASAVGRSIPGLEVVLEQKQVATNRYCLRRFVP